MSLVYPQNANSTKKISPSFITPPPTYQYHYQPPAQHYYGPQQTLHTINPRQLQPAGTIGRKNPTVVDRVEKKAVYYSSDDEENVSTKKVYQEVNINYFHFFIFCLYFYSFSIIKYCFLFYYYI